MQTNTHATIVIASLAFFAVAVPSTSYAQDKKDSGEKLEEVVVKGSRLSDHIEAMPGSVTIIQQKDLEQQLAATTDMVDILARLVPSMSASDGGASNFNQTLRGRKPSYLIDGVPISPTLNEVGREARLIDPSTIQRIEVIRGASALYGNSGSAGTINYITKPGRKGPAEFSAELGLQTFLTSPGDSLRPSMRLLGSGGDRLDFRFSGYYEETSGFFDADGNRIPPIPNGASGLADSSIYSLFARVGYDINDHSRLELTGSFYEQGQDTQYTLANGDVSEGLPTTAVPKLPTDIEEADQAHENRIVNATYVNNEVLGSEVRLQVFHQFSASVFGYSANRFPLTSKASAQSDTDSKKFGYRFDITTPLRMINDSATLTWGSDFLNDKTTAGLVDGRTFAPTQEIDSLAFFAQFESTFLDGLMTITAGVRTEDTDLEVPDFQSLSTLANLTGGSLDYTATPYNFGVTFGLTDNVDLFAAFTQGYDVTSVARTFRDTPIDVDLTLTKPEPNIVDNYEIGLNGSWDNVRASFAYFYVESTAGQSFRVDPNNPTESVIESISRDEMYGYEITVDATPTENWAIGASYSWLEGEADLDLDGSYETPLQNRRIPPPKLTAYAERNFNDWIVRLQAVRVGDRARFPGSTNFYEGDISSFTVLDVSATGPVGPGHLSLGVNNVLNENYYTFLSQSMQQDSRYSKAWGATLALRYRWDF